MLLLWLSCYWVEEEEPINQRVVGCIVWETDRWKKKNYHEKLITYRWLWEERNRLNGCGMIQSTLNVGGEEEGSVWRRWKRLEPPINRKYWVITAEIESFGSLNGWDVLSGYGLTVNNSIKNIVDKNNQFFIYFLKKKWPFVPNDRSRLVKNIEYVYFLNFIKKLSKILSTYALKYSFRII